MGKRKRLRLGGIAIKLVFLISRKLTIGKKLFELLRIIIDRPRPTGGPQSTAHLTQCQTLFFLVIGNEGDLFRAGYPTTIFFIPAALVIENSE